MFADIKAMLDSEKKYIPLEDGFLVLPAESEPEFFTNDKFMSNDYVQLQMNNISEGKIGRIIGMQIIFLNNIPTGGLRRTPIDGGANLLAFDITYFSSVNNQQCAGERILNTQTIYQRRKDGPFGALGIAIQQERRQNPPKISQCPSRLSVVREW
ncbi:MAG: hypothetical protein LBC42_01600 [Puniceicoccales bacterium]|nr:hypothetical protein [Puniceicoccales bacterium]